jgi:LssY C-terminus
MGAGMEASQLHMIVATIFRELSFLACSMLLLSLPVSAQDLPEGTVLEARLSGATGSRISHRGDPIEATIIAPVSLHGRILVPQGSKLFGSVTNATAIGLGLKHSTATLSYGFRELLIPGGTTIPVNTQLVEVDTAKEHVDDLGTVYGIHPIVSLSSGVAYFAVPLLLANPTIGVPVWGVKSVIAPSANPEIHFPTGAELILRLSTAVTLPEPNTDFRVPAESFSPSDLKEIDELLKNSEQRAHMGDRSSDIVNVLFLGSRSQMDRAFHASGWLAAQRKSPISLYRMYLALTKRSGYPRAPTNALTLNGAPSSFVQQKSLDTVEKRHHVRVWQYPRRANVWLGAGAEDVGFRFKLTHWTHFTDPNIDSERAKVVNDLAFVGCVNAAGLLSRTSADLVQDPKAEYPILTDGNIAVVRLNDCIAPNLMAGVVERSALYQRRSVARALTAFRDDLVRSNVFFTTYNTLKLLGKRKSEPASTHARVVNGEPRELDWLTPVAPPQRSPVQ